MLSGWSLHGAQAQTEDYKRQIEELTARLSNLSAEKANLESRNTLLVCFESSAPTECSALGHLLLLLSLPLSTSREGGRILTQASCCDRRRWCG